MLDNCNLSVMQKPINFTGPGLTCKSNIAIEISLAKPNSGINFVRVAQDYSETFIEAHCDNVVSTLRNVVLGKGKNRICLVEHLLAALALLGLSDLLITVYGPELPIGDGSAKLWLELFDNQGIQSQKIMADIALEEPIIVSKGDSSIIALPSDKFSMLYLMDWNHPAIGKKWQEYKDNSEPYDIGLARTFGSAIEHKLLGIACEAISLTDTGFSSELRYADEPVRHKLLDLLGDLMLSSVNPRRFKAKFISIKGGHDLDIQMAKKLKSML